MLFMVAAASAPRSRRGEAFRWLASRQGSGGVLLAIVGVTVLGTLFSARVRVAGGADAFGYVFQAVRWTQGAPRVVEALAGRIPEVTVGTMAPLGYRAALDNQTMVPTYPPGLPWLMTPFLVAFGLPGAMVVAPVCATLAVLTAAWIARRLDGPRAGLGAAVLLATNPVLLFQGLQPMSDVPACAAWLLAAAAGLASRPAIAGLFTGIALLVRPNLVALTLPVWLLVTFAPAPEKGPVTARPSAVRRAVWFISTLVAPVCALALINTLWYGAPWRSGYGAAGDLFDAGRAATNLSRYAAWTLQTRGLTIWVAVLLAPIILPAGWRRRAAWLLSAMALLNLAAYLPYIVFDHWTYLRFLLPAIGVGSVLAACGLARIARWSGAIGRVAVVCVVAAQAIVGLSVARAQGAFDSAGSARRYALTGDWVRAHTPAGSVVAAMQESGSIWLYGNRSILRWDSISPSRFDVVVSAIEQQGHPVWLVLEAWEVDGFRQRLVRDSRYGDLDWPPAAKIHAAMPVTVYALADRARYHRGEHVDVAHVYDAR